MKQGYWGFWKTLGLLEDSGASEEGQWSYGRILELQTTNAGAAGGFWGFRRTLGLQEKDTGIQPCNQHPPHTTSPWGLSGHKEKVWEAVNAPGSPRVRGGFLGCSNATGWDASSTTARTGLSLHPSALHCPDFHSPHVQLARSQAEEKARLSWAAAVQTGINTGRVEKAHFITASNSTEPNKAPSPAPAAFLSPTAFPCKNREVEGGESPLSQPLKKSFPGRLGLSSFRKAFPPLYGVWARSCCHLQANQLIIIKPTNKVQLVLSPGPPLPAVGRCLFSSWTSQILTLLLPGEHKGPV